MSTTNTPPAYPLPVFNVCGRETQALIWSSDVIAYVRLLGAIRDLRVTMDAPTWSVYLHKAMWRFQLWLTKVVGNTIVDHGKLGNDEIPPFDVLMVWHAYLLHPQAYYEDGLRMNRGLLSRGSLPIRDIESVLGVSGNDIATQNWELKTGEPWVLPSDPKDGYITLSCPACNESIRAAWAAEDGSGWAQDGFHVNCKSCQMTITKEVLCISKFAKDIRKVVDEPRRHTLASLLLDTLTTKPSIATAQIFNDNIVKHLSKTASTDEIASEQLKWSMAEVEYYCRVGFRTSDYMKRLRSDGKKDQDFPGLQGLLAAYSIPFTFSVDLFDTIQRQIDFIHTIFDLGFGQTENPSIDRCVSQYHSFLDLAGKNRDTYLVPTTSIELGWQTHLMLFPEYHEATMAHIGLLLEHETAVEQETMAQAFHTTAKLWTKNYSVPYSICGCPVSLGGDRGVLQGLLTDLKSAFGDKKSPTGGQVNNSRPDLLSLEHPQETHPAGFAATKVLNYAPVDETPSSRRKKETKLLQEDQAAVEQGKASPWQEFVVRRRKVGSHSPAFDKDETSYGTIDAIHMPYCGGTVGIGRETGTWPGSIKFRLDPVRVDWVTPRSTLAFPPQQSHP